MTPSCARPTSQPAEDWRPVPAQPDDRLPAVHLRSTGTPKGVMVAQRNVRAFIRAVADRYAILPEDRLSQMFDLTFDLSAFDMFVTWEHGACLCCPAEAGLMAPGRFIRDSRLTVWFSVPSVGVFARRLGMLKPGAFPSLRLSLFCGEPLPAAAAWGAAPSLGGREPLRADRGDDRLHRLPLGRRSRTVRVHPRGGADRRAAARHPDAGRRRRSAGGAAGGRGRAARPGPR
ncbi:MAG: AMP-binding protein [Solirubrobacterales bacterium]